MQVCGGRRPFRGGTPPDLHLGQQAAFARIQKLLQITTLAVLHHDVKPASLHKRVAVLHDVLVVDAPQQPHLVQREVLHLRAEPAHLHLLDHVLDVLAQVCGKVYPSKGAAAEAVAEPEVPPRSHRARRPHRARVMIPHRVDRLGGRGCALDHLARTPLLPRFATAEGQVRSRRSGRNGRPGLQALRCRRPLGPPLVPPLVTELTAP